MSELHGSIGPTRNYENLANLPSINDVRVVGNLTPSDLGLADDASVEEIRSALENKVDKVTGKGLSENDYTDGEKAKLEGIEAGAEKNVQSDWDASDGSDAFIKNKPSVLETVTIRGTATTKSGTNTDLDVYKTAEVDSAIDTLDNKIDTNVADLDERKAEIDGYYETFTSGQTNQLIATEAVTDTEPYIYRKTGGPNDVGDRVYDEIVGGSVVWNQLVNSGDTEVTVPNGHKYYANINGTKSIGASTGTAIPINDSTKDNVIDLTAALTPTIADYIYSLEQTTAGAGVAWFRKYFPDVYYGYTEPHFEHVQVSAKNTVGFNQFDEELEFGNINTSGEPEGTSAKYIRSKNFTEVFPSTEYCYHIESNNGFMQCYTIEYDGNKNFISRTNRSGAGSDIVNTSTIRFTTNSNTRYIKLFVYKSTDYTSIDTKINLNFPGDRDGEYEAYKKRTYPLDSSLTLRGIPKLDSANRLYFDGDIYRHDGSGEYRFGLLDLGELTYTYFSEYNYPFFRCNIYNKNGKLSNEQNYKVIGYDYVTGSYTALSSNMTTAMYGSSSGSIFITFRNDAYTDATAFKTAMSGVYLLYELNTPEPFTAEPFQSPMVVDPLGTEEFVDYAVEQGDRDVAVPVGHKSEYPADLRGKLQRLPSPTGTNGDYIVTEVDGKLYLKPYVPAVGLTAPTTEGESE